MTSEHAGLIFATTAEFAAIIRASDSYVRRLKRSDKLVLDERGRIVVAASLEQLGRVLDPARGGNRATPKPAGAQSATGGAADRLNYNVQAAREKLAAAQLRELELAREAGSLVLKAERDAAEFGRARAAREAILSLPDKCASRCQAAADVSEVYAILIAECRRICRDMAAMPDADVDPGSTELEVAA
jgi:hypothetical protein